MGVTGGIADGAKTAAGMDQRVQISPWAVPVGLAAAPALGYLLAYSYEVGRTGVYDMPWAFISPQLGSVLLATVIVVFFGTGMFFLLELLLTLPFHRLAPSVRRVAIILIPFGVLCLLSVLIFESRWQEWVWTFWLLATGLITLLVLEFGLPLLEFKISGYQAKFERFHRREFWKRGLVPQRQRAFARSVLLGLVGLFIAAYASFAEGRAVGLDVETYLVAPGNPPLAVLRVYGDTAILAPFDQKAQTITPLFQVIRLSAGTQNFRLQQIGILTRDCHPVFGCRNGGSVIGGT
jgi:hypothetical protein